MCYIIINWRVTLSVSLKEDVELHSWTCLALECPVGDSMTQPYRNSRGWKVQDTRQRQGGLRLACLLTLLQNVQIYRQHTGCVIRFGETQIWKEGSGDFGFSEGFHTQSLLLKPWAS